jgi:hypothetical protein
MKRALVLTLAVLFLCGAATWGRTDYFDAITIAGAFTLTGTAATAFTGTTFAVDMSSTAVIDGATSVRNLSAGFNSLESPANRFGVSATVYTQIATTATTGVTAITHTGTGPTMAWTVPVWTFTNSTSNTTYTPSWVMGFDAGSSMTVAVADTSGFATITHTGNATGFSWTATTGGFTCATSLTALTPSFVVGFDAGSSVAFGVADTSGALTVSHTGNATALSWTAATATWTHSTSDTFYTPTFVVGYDAGSSITFAVADTSGAVTITHAGNATAVTWTATNFDFVGAMAADAVTLSDVLTFSDAATIDNTDANTLTITEVNIVLEGIAKTNSLKIDDGDVDLTVDSDNQTNASATINVPDFTDATADFLVTNLFTTVLPFAGGLRGEDTDGAGTNGGGLVGGAPDITTHTYTNATDDVFVLVYDVGTTTWDALATSALLTAGADWAANWQLLPDADAEEAGDAFAIGFATPFCEVVFDDLATAAGALATWGGNGGKWQYSTGAGTWSDLTVFDNTDVTAYDGLRSLQRTGAITFVPPANWVAATYDGVTKYWIQYVITAAQLTQTPLIDATNKDEPFIAVPNADTFSAPYKLEITKVRVTNMGLTIHDQAMVFVVANFTDGVYSAAQTWTASQLTDKFTLGTAIAADPGDLIGICITNDTGSTVNPIWAIEFEVTYED